MRTLVVGCAVLAMAAAGQKDYKHLIGQQARICGTVVTYTDEGDDCSVRLDLGRPYWSPAFYVVVPNGAIGRFTPPPEIAYLHQDVCVSGLVKPGDKGVPHIVGEQASQFEVTKTRSEEPFGAGIQRACGPGRTPKLLKEVKPNYSTDGIAAKIQGRVLLDAIVDIEGRVGDVRVVYGLEPSLDREAARALKQWRFAPTIVNGAAIPTIVQVEMSFTLRK